MDFLRNNIVGLITLVLLVAAGFVGSTLGQPVEAQVPDQNGEVVGWAWSYNTGWLSFNCISGGGCADSDYGVRADMDEGSATFGQLSGYAWSANLGWLSFNAADVAECGPTARFSNFEQVFGSENVELSLTGWAKFLSQNQTDPDDTFWNGCVSLDGVAQDNSPYGVTLNTQNNFLSGYAWGDEVTGWITFKCQSCGVALVVDPPLVSGCTDPEAVNYNPNAQVDNNSCEYTGIGGCMDPSANNYNPEATSDDGSCQFGPIFGCTDSLATNYNGSATVDNGSCTYTTNLSLDASPNVINSDNVTSPVSLVPGLLSGFTATSCSITNNAGAPISGQNVSVTSFSLPLQNNQSFVSDVSSVDPGVNPIIVYTLSCDGLQNASDIVTFLEGCTDPSFETFNSLAIISNPSMCSNDPTPDNPGGSPIFIEI